MSATIVREENNADEINRLQEKIMPAVAGESLHLVAAAFLAILIHNMHPGVTHEQLCEAVAGSTSWLSTFLGTLPGADGTPVQVN